MSRLFQALLGLVFGALAFTVADRYFHLQTWESALLAIIAAAVVFINHVVDFVQRVLNVEKSRGEIAKLAREAEEDKKAKEDERRRVKLATPDEVEQYGASYTERRIRTVIRVQEEKDRLKAKSFVARGSIPIFV